MERKTLDRIEVGETAVITDLSASGALRRRFLDIGLTSGCRVKCIFSAPAGNPKAFIIRGTVIALRLEDCRMINIEME